jgi:hypothetical protein
VAAIVEADDDVRVQEAALLALPYACEDDDLHFAEAAAGLRVDRVAEFAPPL